MAITNSTLTASERKLVQGFVNGCCSVAELMSKGPRMKRAVIALLANELGLEEELTHRLFKACGDMGSVLIKDPHAEIHVVKRIG